MEPKVGDLGVLQADNEKSINMTDEEMKNIHKEQIDMHLRESELQELIKRDSVRLTEDEMRKLEESYTQVKAE